MRRQQLTEAQITALLDPPTDQRELVRHYTLSAADLAAIRRCRGDRNRLGHALMLCYLRYPGRPLKAGERPPRPLLSFIAEQIDALPEAIEDYLAAERNRRRHAAELQDRLGFRPFGTRPAADLAGWLLPHAIENDRLVHLAGLVVEECRRRRIVVPSPSALEQLCVQARYQARGEVQRRLTDGLSTDQRRWLDVLTQRRAETNQSLLGQSTGWPRSRPTPRRPRWCSGATPSGAGISAMNPRIIAPYRLRAETEIRQRRAITVAPAHDLSRPGSEEVLPRHRGEGRLDPRVPEATGCCDLFHKGAPDDFFSSGSRSILHMAGGQGPG